MNIEILYAKGAGNIIDERIVLKALDKTDIGKYAITSPRFDEGNNTFYTLANFIFWLPDQIVEKNDLIVIYTKDGIPSSKLNKSRAHSYFYYMGLDHPIWNNPENRAMLMNVNDWILKKV